MHKNLLKPVVFRGMKNLRKPETNPFYNKPDCLYCSVAVNLSITTRRRVSVDLQQLWENAEPSPSVDTTNQIGAAIIAEICTAEQSDVAQE